MSAPRRIALCGLAGSGKSTAAKYLVERHHFRRLSYATPIKRMVRCFMIEAGADLMQSVEMVDGALKEVPSELLAGHSPRYLMQSLGTEWGRDLVAQDIWRRILLAKVDHHHGLPIVVDDLRFPNEADGLRAAGFTIVRIIRAGAGTQSGHSSEEQEFDVDHLVENDHGIAHLHSKLDELL